MPQLVKELRRRRTQAERSEASRLGLIQAAIAVILESGIDAATFERIGRAGGYSRGLAGLHFGSKQKLFEAIVEYLTDKEFSSLREVMDDNLTGLDTILTYVDRSVVNSSSNPDSRAFWIFLSAAVAGKLPMLEFFKKSYENLKDILKSIINRGISEGNIKHEIDSDAASMMIGSFMIGVSFQLFIDQSSSIDSTRLLLRQLLIDSLKSEK